MRDYENSKKGGKGISDHRLEAVIQHYKYREEKVFFRGDYGLNWQDAFSTKEMMEKLFVDIGITDVKIKITRITIPSKDRVTLLVAAKNSKTDEVTKAIVDFIMGSPTYEQFIDARYDSGLDTSLKVIVYDNDSLIGYEYDPPGSSFEILNLVKKNNRCNVPTVLLQAVFMRKKGEKALKFVRLYSDDRNSVIPTLETNKTETLPTKTQVQESEFWIAYHFQSMSELEGGVRENFGDDFDPTTIHEMSYDIRYGNDDSGLMVCVSWAEQGLLLTLDANDPQVMHKLWKDREKAFMEKYPDGRVEFQPNAQKGPVIVVNPIKIKISELITMDPKDKWYYGKLSCKEVKKIKRIVYNI